MKIEKDKVRILGGLMGGQTTRRALGAAGRERRPQELAGQGSRPHERPAPRHADLTGALKYGYHDLRPALERSSARETTMRVAAGAVCKHFLAQFGIRIGGYVCSMAVLRRV